MTDVRLLMPAGADRYMAEETDLSATVAKTSTRQLPQDFERMYREHHDLVYRAAYRITGNGEDAEDVLQTLFLRLLRRDCPPDIEHNPKAYLHRAAINIALDVVKLRNRSISTDGREEHVEDPRPNQDRQQSSSEIQAWLRSALSELSPKA